MPEGQQATPYYAAYEDRYRSVYAQGVRYWTACPDELAAVERAVEPFLDDLGASTDMRVAEFGCGEGYAGELVVRRGYRYTGIDIAPSAAEKARDRLSGSGTPAHVLVGNVLRLPFPDASFGAALDVSCLHMLVVDADRRAYLREARRVLVPGAPMLFCHAAFRPDATDDEVSSHEQWLAMTGVDLGTAEEREAWHDGRPVTITSPRLAARAQSADGYRAEMANAGFRFGESRVAKDGQSITFAVEKSGQAI